MLLYSFVGTHTKKSNNKKKKTHLLMKVMTYRVFYLLLFGWMLC